ncbi:MAG: hypothetical protein NT145_03415 [Elusimicrobia bacterium]|nr:hypothetical protein [Elusimicrobiota bacterium]
MSSIKKTPNLQNDRYRVFKMAKEWMGSFIHSDEAKNLNRSEIVRRVLEDILLGKMTEEDIEKAKKEKIRKTPENKSEEKKPNYKSRQ